MQQDSDPKHSSNVWARISPQSCERLIKSYIKPLLQVIAAKGGSTGYWIFVCLYIYGEHGWPHLPLYDFFFLFNTEICDSIMKCFIHLPNKQKISGSIPGRERNQTSGGSHCGGRLVNKGEAESSFLFNAAIRYTFFKLLYFHQTQNIWL